MYTTVSKEGLLNNYATEPDMYYAEYPSPEQQLKYAQMGAAASLFVATLLLISFAVS